jgi:primosomal protein N' (replication factor Y)
LSYKVIVDLSNSAVDKFFHYNSDFPVPNGSRVSVPFGSKVIEGFVIEETDDSEKATKNIVSILDPYPVILPEMVEMSKFMKKSNVRFIDALRLCIPADLRAGRVRELARNFVDIAETVSYQDAKKLISEKSQAQHNLLDRLSTGGAFEYVLTREGFSVAVINRLVDKGILEKRAEEIRRTPKSASIERKSITLTNEQRNAVDEILTSDDNTFLIHGVTGSGKTEIYMTVIENLLQSEKTAIMLVPEISLTPQMLGVFRNRFGDKVSLLHSGLSAGERYDEWRRLYKGESQVAMGPRSAIFAPVRNVGAIIIDEEHDTSYSSEKYPRFLTLDIAEFRARYNDAKLILGSATPSIETYLKAREGTVKLITLQNRINDFGLPTVEVVDMRKEIRGGNVSIFSRLLVSTLSDTLLAKEQAIVFVNRRGYASFVRCKNCGYVAMCTDCDVSLTYHRDDKRLKCHYCGKQFHELKVCPQCGNQHLAEGFSGTEKVASEISNLFPTARVARLDNDSVSGKDAHLQILTKFGSGEIDILVGTQMVTKGHDFKNVTLVGILDADQSLYFPDYGSNERTFQLITQVAGRAGRESKPGRVIMQTYNPNHPVFEFATDYDYLGFYERESAIRRVTKFPPYTKIVRILITGKEEEPVRVVAQALRDKTRDLMNGPLKDSFIRVQAMSAPIKRLENNYRYQVIAVLNPDCDDALYSIFAVAAIDDKNIHTSVEINPRQMT